MSIVDVPPAVSPRATARALGRAVVTLAAMLCSASLAQADKIKNGTAVFSGLDKITGRIISFEAGMGETVQFGSLKVTARSCLTRPATETPQTDTFVEVDEVSAGNDDKRIFSGWMYAASPGLHGIEHPIYDIWLTGCKSPGETTVEAPVTASAEPPPPGTAAPTAGTTATPAVPSAGGDLPPKPAAPPRPRRVARPAPPPAAPRPAAVVERREPTQRFFPTSQYPADFGGKDPAGSNH